MPVRHLLPFALPTGRTGRVGRLTVYFSPRLKDGGRLQDYQEWLDWPATLTNRLALDVFVDGLPVGHRVLSPGPSSAVWTAVFGPRTPVAAHRVVDFRTTPRQPMASGDFSEAVLDLYLRTAREHPVGLPSGPQLWALAEAAGFANGSGAEPEPGSLAEANAYRAPMADADENDPAAPRFDLHASLSLLGHHPELLRHLGLAVDLEVDLPAAPSRVSVTTGYGVPGGPRFEADLVTGTTADFRALPNPEPTRTEQSDGFLRLAVERAFLSVVDPQLAASRLTQAADQATRHGAGTLPALASRALTLVRPDLTNVFDNRTKRQAELEDALEVNLTGGAPVELYAEDVTIGHRIDVLDLTDATAWLSLFERQSDAGYTFARDSRLTVVPKPDEGWNTTILVTEQEDVRPDTDGPIRPTALFRLDDAVYRWNGWSGAVPGVGDTPDVLVLRSDVDVDDATVEPVDRLIFPGRVGQDLCELHGQPAGGTDPASYAELARRDARDLTDRDRPGQRRGGRGGDERPGRSGRGGPPAAGRRLPLRPGGRERPLRLLGGRGRGGAARGLAEASGGPVGGGRR